MFRLPVFSLLLPLLLATACTGGERQARQMTRSAAAAEARLGLPPLDPHFLLQQYGRGFCVWINPQLDFPKQWSKSIYWNDSGVYAERNAFYRSEGERMLVAGTFRAAAPADSAGVTYWYQASPSDTGRYLPRAEGDSLLQGWGLRK